MVLDAREPRGAATAWRSPSRSTAAGGARLRGRGDRLEQLGRLAEALGDRRRPARRRPAPAAEHAGDHLPGRARGRRTRPAAGRRSRAGRDRLRPEQRRRLVVHERDGRRDGPVRRADRRRHVRVRRRAAATRADRGGDRGQGRREPERLVVRATHHGPIVNEALRADDDEPLALRWTALDCARRHRGEPRRYSTSRSGAGAGRLAGAAQRAGLEPGLGRPPGLDRLQDDRPRPDPRGAAARTCRSPAGPASTSGRAGCPTRSCPSWSTRSRATSLTANNRITPEDYPHHITSDYLDGYRARRIEELIDRRGRARPRQLRGDADGHALDPRARDRPPARPAARPRPARDGGDRAAAQLGRADEPGLGRGDDLPGVHAAARARGRRGWRSATATSRERWLDRADNGFIAHVTSPWRWQSHLLALWEEGDAELIGRDWDELALDSLRGALDELERPVRRRSRRVALGQGPRARLPARARRRQPAPGGDLQPPARGRRRPGDGRPGRLGPERPVRGDLGPVLADGRRPGRPGALALAGVHRPVRPRRQPPLRRPPARWAGGGTQAMAGEGPGEP